MQGAPIAPYEGCSATSCQASAASTSAAMTPASAAASGAPCLLRRDRLYDVNFTAPLWLEGVPIPGDLRGGGCFGSCRSRCGCLGWSLRSRCLRRRHPSRS